MKKRRVAVLMAAVLLIGSMWGCAGQGGTEGSNAPQESAVLKEDAAQGQTLSEATDEEQDAVDISAENEAAGAGVYTVEADLSNIDNLWQYYLNDEIKDKLVQNYFVVCGDAGNEFFEVYEQNRYGQLASFVTVDSLMHTYHLYFSYLMKNVERDYLCDKIGQLSKLMLEDSMQVYESLKGSEWENAAKRNVAFFTVGLKLLEEETAVNDYVQEMVDYELNHINNAEWIDTSVITGGMEDYTQYIPRGYYEGDEKLERYFRAMMWYGRIHFSQEEEDLTRSALLIAQVLSQDAKAYELWAAVYDITSFFAGASDDLGVNEYIPVMQEIYGDSVTADALLADPGAFARFHEMTANLPVPRINSIPIWEWEGDDNVIPGFRFMGQRFTIDASIMQELIYRRVEKNSAGEKRMLPDVLDVPAALGSDIALRILEDGGVTDYVGYSENMEKLREFLSGENDTLWSASLYAGWLHTLRPLLEIKGEDYPLFMQSEEWAKKDLECFAGSYTELKHDTILYSKQVIAEMGGGYDEEPDDRGYVEPEPLVYERFADLSDRTAQGLKERGMLSADAEEDLSRLSEMAGRLLEISEKELKDETLTEDEYEFIRAYGGNIEHFWYEAVKEVSGEEGVSSQESPAALVVDIATNPDGAVLEAATDSPSTIYVIVMVDGKMKIAKGSVYSFYQFAWPLDDRLTDSRWRQMMGIQPDEEGYYNHDTSIEKPEWTNSYRYKYEWE